MRRVLGFLAAACISAFGSTQVTLDFTGTSNSASGAVQTYYQQMYGITFSAGAMVWNTYLYNPGVPNSVFSYVDPADANCAKSNKTDCLSLVAPFSNNMVMQGVAGGPENIIMNVPSGFSGFFSFQSEGSYGPSSVSVYSGLNGTGTLLTTFALPASGDASHQGVFKKWSNEISLDPTLKQTFNGTAMSAVFDQGTLPNGTGSGYIEYDNLSFLFNGVVGGATVQGGSVGPLSANAVFAPAAMSENVIATPEPATVTLFLGGALCMVPGAWRRLRRRS